MKNDYIDIYLIVALVALLYYKPQFLTNIANTSLGKLILLVGVIYLAHNHSISTGIMGGLIFILLIHNILEGVDDTLEKAPKEETYNSEQEDDDQNENENEENDNEFSDNNVTDLDEQKSNKDKLYKKSDLMNNEEMLKSDLLVPSSVDSDNTLSNDEPAGVAMDSKTQEGFSLIN